MAAEWNRFSAGHGAVDSVIVGKKGAAQRGGGFLTVHVLRAVCNWNVTREVLRGRASRRREGSVTCEWHTEW